MNNWISVAWTSSSSWPPAIISDTNWSAALSFYEPVKKMTLEELTKVKEECRSWTCCFSWENIWKIDVLKFQSNAFQWIAFESTCAVRKSLLWASLATDLEFWFNNFWLLVRFFIISGPVPSSCHEVSAWASAGCFVGINICDRLQLFIMV